MGQLATAQPHTHGFPSWARGTFPRARKLQLGYRGSGASRPGASPGLLEAGLQVTIHCSCRPRTHLCQPPVHRPLPSNVTGLGPWVPGEVLVPDLKLPAGATLTCSGALPLDLQALSTWGACRAPARLSQMCVDGVSMHMCAMTVRSHNPQLDVCGTWCPHEFGGVTSHLCWGRRDPLCPWQQAALYTLGSAAMPAPALQAASPPGAPSLTFSALLPQGLDDYGARAVSR